MFICFLPICHACSRQSAVSVYLKRYAPDNSSLPSQLQFRQDSGVFPVMAVPGYFLFVLIRSCMLNEIMLIRDSRIHTSVYLVLFRMIHGVSLGFVPKSNGCTMGRECPKDWYVPPPHRGSAGKKGARRPGGGWDLLPGKCPGGLSSLFLRWEVGGAPEPLKGGHGCELNGLCVATGMCPGRQGWSVRDRHLFPSLCQGSSGALQTPASGTHLPSTTLGRLVASLCTSQAAGTWR